jgi:hypothetical protein
VVFLNSSDSVVFLNYSDSVVFFVFHFIVKHGRSKHSIRCLQREKNICNKKKCRYLI